MDEDKDVGQRTWEDGEGRGYMRTKPRENDKGQQGRRKREWVRTRERRGEGG